MGKECWSQMNKTSQGSRPNGRANSILRTPKKTKRSNRLVGWYCFRVFGIFIILCCILCYSLYIVLHYIISIIILAITLLPTGFDDIWWADYYDKITFYFIGVYILWNGNPVLKQAGIPGDTSCSEGCFSLKKFNVLVITSASWKIALRFSSPIWPCTMTEHPML